MLTKGAIGNLANRYRAVLKKCNLINTFGSLAVASMLVLGGAGVASASTLTPTTYLDETGTLLAGITSDYPVSDGLLTVKGVATGTNASSTRVYGVAAANGTDISVSGNTNFDFSADGDREVRAIRLLGKNTDQTSIVMDGNVTISARTENGEAYGIDARYNSTLDIKGTTNIEVYSNVSVSNNDRTAYGICAANKSGNYGYVNLNFDGMTNIYIKNKGTGYSTGIYSAYNNIVKFNNGLSINIDDNGTSSNNSDVQGLELMLTPTFNTHKNIGLFVSGDTFNVNASAQNKNVTGLQNGGSIVKITADTMTIDAYSNKQTAKGIEIGGGASLTTATNTSVNITAKSTDRDASGLFINDYTASNAPSIGLESHDDKVILGGNTTISSTAGANAYAIRALYGTTKLNGSTNSITAKSTGAGNAYAIYTANDAKVTLNGNTTLNGDVYVTDEATLTLNDTVNLNGTLTNKSSTAINGSATVVFGADSKGEKGNTIASTLKAKASGDLNDKLSGDLNKFKEEYAIGFNAANVTMEEGLIAGAVDANGVQKVNTVLADTLEQATAAPLAVNRILMNDVRKRMGDLRADKNESGVWMRWDGGKLQGDGLSNDFNTIQIGGDTKVAKNCRFGVAGSFTHGDIDHSNGGGEMETYTFAAYGTWMAESGMFADVIARVGFTNSEIMAKGGKADIDNEAVSLSGEYGWRLPVCEQFFVEPQVELTYTHVTGADFSIRTADYNVDSVDSLLGRAGLVAGWNLPNDMGNVYARASVVHEFLGDSKISATNNGGYAAHELDGDDTWIEYGIGANVKLTDKTYVWADVERTSGAELDEEWRGTVGIRVSF